MDRSALAAALAAGLLAPAGGSTQAQPEGAVPGVICGSDMPGHAAPQADKSEPAVAA